MLPEDTHTHKHTHTYLYYAMILISKTVENVKLRNYSHATLNVNDDTYR